MANWNSNRLPVGYQCAAIDPPEERSRYCTCGHSIEDHNDNACLDDASALRDALLEIRNLIDDDGWLPLRKVQAIVDKSLVSCQATNCTCTKFVDAETI